MRQPLHCDFQASSPRLRFRCHQPTWSQGNVPSSARDVKQGCSLRTHAFKTMRGLKRTWMTKQKFRGPETYTGLLLRFLTLGQLSDLVWKSSAISILFSDKSIETDWHSLIFFRHLADWGWQKSAIWDIFLPMSEGRTLAATLIVFVVSSLLIGKYLF